MWKFGLLGRTFFYRIFERYADGRPIWVSSTQPSSNQNVPDFGNAAEVFNVIDVRQSYLQRVVIQGLRNLGFDEQADRSTHFSYEMVALSPASCRELAIELDPEDESKPFVEMSGRKGLGVKADDLIDKVIEKSVQEVETRQAHLDLETRRDIAQKIAIGALRYFLLKYTRTAVIAFDFNEALSFEGETGPYILYSVVRANNIFRKLDEEGFQWSRQEWLGRLAKGDFSCFLEDDRVWEMLIFCGRSEEVIERCIQTLEVSHLARQAFQQAQLFNFFYHSRHILSQTDPDQKLFLVGVTDVVRASLLRLLGLLGINAPERM
jgi:arginyl-tRNA synthetase